MTVDAPSIYHGTIYGITEGYVKVACANGLTVVCVRDATVYNIDEAVNVTYHHGLWKIVGRALND